MKGAYRSEGKAIKSELPREAAKKGLSVGPIKDPNEAYFFQNYRKNLIFFTKYFYFLMKADTQNGNKQTHTRCLWPIMESK